MTDVTLLLEAAAGDRQTADDLLPLVYAELSERAAGRMADEAVGHTLDPTALVREAYLRLVPATDAPKWDGRGHLFAAAATRPSDRASTACPSRPTYRDPRSGNFWHRPARNSA